MGQFSPRRNICFGSGTKHEWVEGGEAGLQEREGQPITEESGEERKGEEREEEGLEAAWDKKKKLEGGTKIICRSVHRKCRSSVRKWQGSLFILLPPTMFNSAKRSHPRPSVGRAHLLRLTAAQKRREKDKACRARGRLWYEKALREKIPQTNKTSAYSCKGAGPCSG